jgi:hypothetical protein
MVAWGRATGLGPTGCDDRFTHFRRRFFPEHAMRIVPTQAAPSIQGRQRRHGREDIKKIVLEVNRELKDGISLPQALRGRGIKVNSWDRWQRIAFSQAG